LRPFPPSQPCVRLSPHTAEARYDKRLVVSDAPSPFPPSSPPSCRARVLRDRPLARCTAMRRCRHEGESFHAPAFASVPTEVPGSGYCVSAVSTFHQDEHLLHVRCLPHLIHVSPLSGRIRPDEWPIPYPPGYGFPLPFGGRLSLLGSSFPTAAFRSPYGRPTVCLTTPTAMGFPRSASMSDDRGGCPLYSGVVMPVIHPCLMMYPLVPPQ